MPPKRKRSVWVGFTLVELLVTIAIISILAAIGFPAFTGYLSNAADADAKNTLRMISAAQERYQMLTGSYFQTSPPSVPSAATTSQIQSTLLNNLNVNTKYYLYSVQTTGCAPQPTGVARQFCAFAQKTGQVTRFTIDDKDAIYDQNNILQ